MIGSSKLTQVWNIEQNNPKTLLGYVRAEMMAHIKITVFHFHIIFTFQRQTSLTCYPLSEQAK